MEKNNRISFLDITLIKEGEIIFDLYRKPSFSGRYLNFFSHHPSNYKKRIIFGLTNKVIKLSYPQFHQKNLTDIISRLIMDTSWTSFSPHNRLKKFTYNNFLNNVPRPRMDKENINRISETQKSLQFHNSCWSSKFFNCFHMTLTQCDIWGHYHNLGT